MDGTDGKACLLLELHADVLSDRILACLTSDALASASTACRALLATATGSSTLWRALALDALGAAACALYEVAEPRLLRPVEKAAWWRGLARAAHAGGPLHWDETLKRFYDGAEARRLLRCCAHTAVAVGEVVLLIGGSRVDNHPPSGVVVVDCRNFEVRAAALAPGSAAPAPRLRHGACEIAPERPGDPARVLVLGGVTEDFGAVEEVHSGAEALVLEVLDPGAQQVRWRTQPLQGDAPGGGSALFHHTLLSFDQGRRAIAWGGDTHDFEDVEDDQELARIYQSYLERSECAFVLDVAAWQWSRIRTCGIQPGHRSLAQGVVHGGRMVVLGGTCEPKPPRAFAHGALASLGPRVLNLKTWEWLPPRGYDAPLPAPRTRFALERRGDWLLGFGGRGANGEILGDIFQFHLETLSQNVPAVCGPSAGAAGQSREVCASSMCGNIVLGGLRRGIVCCKADALLLRHGGVAQQEAEERGSDDEDMGNDDDGDDGDDRSESDG